MECYIDNHGVKYIKARPFQKIWGMKKELLHVKVRSGFDLYVFLQHRHNLEFFRWNHSNNNFLNFLNLIGKERELIEGKSHTLETKHHLLMWQEPKQTLDTSTTIWLYGNKKLIVFWAYS